MWIRKMLVAFATVGALTAVVSARWIEPSHLTDLTFSGPVRLPGVTLPAGTYRFEIADPNVSLNIVRVSSKARSTVYYMGFTDRVERPANLPAGFPVSLGETPRGAAPPIIAWYPDGVRFAHRFRYSENK
jgi:hypothetical protein